MKNLLIAAALTMLTATAGLAQTVRIASEGAYPPYNLINDNGDLAGFEIDLGTELCKRAALSCTWVKNDWDSIIPNLVSGNYDAVMAGMAINAERQQVITFSDIYIPPASSAYVGLSDDADIENGVVAAQTNTIQASHVATTGATLIEFATPDETLAAVRNGEADAVLADKDYLVPHVTESNDQLVWIGDDIFLDAGIAVGLRQSDDALRETFNTALATMKEDGSLNVLISRWFGEDARLFE